jgi:hypothetical protein
LVLLSSAVLTAGRGAAERPPFAEVAAQAGLDFVHDNGMAGEMYFPEMLGPGVALLDADGDGDLDVFAGQGDRLGPGDGPGGAPAAGRGAPGQHRLYRNDLVAGPDGGSLAFTDVTAASGIAPGGYNMGVATGDYDGDGDPDLYLANYGSDRLLRNDGGGRFTDVSAAAGVGTDHWSAGASFADFDRDGDLDLWVVHYVRFDVAENPTCFAPSSRRDYCGPADFPPVADRLLENRGDGTFADVSARAGIARAARPGLGVVVLDADGDGWPDVYVANDGAPNQLWVNRRDGTFRDDAVLAGVAVNADGRAEAGMGVDAGDYDNDGDEDLVVVHLQQETNTLYANLGGGLWEDVTAAAGLAAPSLPFTSFGAGWIDYDHDGWLDLLVANGAVRILEERARQGDPFPLAMTNQLFRNLGPDAAGRVRFTEVTGEAGPAFALAEVSRAAAFGDLDDDGDTDVVISHAAGPLRLLRNEVGQDRPWLGLRLVDRDGREAVGARVEVRRRGAPTLVRRSHTDGSYGAASDPRVRVGLGGGAEVTGIRVTWPDGASETWPAPPLGRYTTLVAGRAPATAEGGAEAVREPRPPEDDDR